MSLNNKSPEHHVAYGAAMEGVAAASASIGVIGRYWWNLQMKLLVATGTMRFFRAYWWLFLVSGFFLLAFVMPLGVAFVLSVFCASAMKPKAEDNFIVPLKTQEIDIGDNVEGGRTNGKEILRILFNEAELRHIAYLKVSYREIHDLSDKELAATALGAFDGTLRTCSRLVEFCGDEVLNYGPAFVVTRLKRLGRYKEDGEDWLDEVMLEPRTSEALKPLRLEAERFACEMEPLETPQPVDLEQVQIAASIHHLGYLGAIKRDVDDKEFAAAALGAFDGTLQACGTILSDLDMHANGAAFIVAQLTSLERVDEVDPELIAEVTEEAMTSKALEAIRAESGRFAYTMEKATRYGSNPSV